MAVPRPVDHRHRLGAPEQGHDAPGEVVQGVPVLGEDDQLAPLASSVELKLPDGLSEYLTHVGVAQVFEIPRSRIFWMYLKYGCDEGTS